MSKNKNKAKLFRTILLILWLLCIAAGIIWLFGPFIHESLGGGLLGTPSISILGPLSYAFDDELGTAAYIAMVLFYLAFFFLTQWLFLNPKKFWKIKIEHTGRPMKKAVIAAAFAATLISVALLYSIIDLFSSDFYDDISSKESILSILFLLIPISMWILWSVIFFVYSRKSDYNTWSAKLLRAIFAGSVLELFVSIGVYTTRQDDCYCARGSYTGIIFGTTALLWCFGPGIVFLYIKEKKRSENLKEIL